MFLCDVEILTAHIKPIFLACMPQTIYRRTKTKLPGNKETDYIYIYIYIYIYREREREKREREREREKHILRR